MKTIEIAVPYDQLMDVIEDYLVYSGKIESNEGIAFIDLGLPIDDEGNVIMNAEVETLPTEQEPAAYPHLVV